MARRVVITGMGVVTALGNTLDQYWAGLCEGKSGVGELTLFDTDWKDVAPYIYVLRLRDGSRRKALIEHLKARGIATGIHFLGAHEFSFYATSRRSKIQKIGAFLEKKSASDVWRMRVG